MTTQPGVTREHTVTHALRPRLCNCSMKDVLVCAICGRGLLMPRTHFDTCSERCFAALVRAQRALGGRVE